MVKFWTFRRFKQKRDLASLGKYLGVAGKKKLSDGLFFLFSLFTRHLYAEYLKKSNLLIYKWMIKTN